MLKVLLILAVGICIGYSIGWKDAQKNDRHIVERTVDRVGGKNRGKYDQDIDRRLESDGRR